MSDGVVLIVHSIDTEGPLYESIHAKFERLKDLFNIDFIEPNQKNLTKLKNKEFELNGIEAEVTKILSGHLANYNEDWSQIQSMLNRITSAKFRNQVLDSFGNGWIYNWHCMDHVDYDYNPRRRDIGYHNIYDFYVDFLNENPSRDSIQWHFHPMSAFKEANRCASNYLSDGNIFQILSRKIIERKWFPQVYRAGFQTERPDSNWFLEQWIPFDLSNMATESVEDLQKFIDFKNGRGADWRGAPTDWSIYNPSHDYYQVPGNCRRWIGRSLNVLNRIASINAYEMEKAFMKAKAGDFPVVGIAGHDWRDLSVEVEHVLSLIKSTKKKFPDVSFKFCQAVEAFQIAITQNAPILQKPIKLDLVLNEPEKNDVHTLNINLLEGEVFGPQPFLALELYGKRFMHDNLDFQNTAKNSWSYAFHTDTVPISEIKKIGIAACDKYGRSDVKVLDLGVS